jgi:hypothetical protein
MLRNKLCEAETRAGKQQAFLWDIQCAVLLVLHSMHALAVLQHCGSLKALLYEQYVFKYICVRADHGLLYIELHSSFQSRA